MLKLFPVTARSSSSSCSDKAVNHTAKLEGKASCSFLKRAKLKKYCGLRLVGVSMFYWEFPSVTLSFIFIFLLFLTPSFYPFFFCDSHSHSFLFLIESIHRRQRDGRQRRREEGLSVDGGVRRVKEWRRRREEKGEMEKEWTALSCLSTQCWLLHMIRYD